MAKVPTVLFMMVVFLVDPIHGAPQVPCFFIFGDSLADNGNNNNLLTRAKVNYQPYGIDFLTGPTGRFCNGRTTVDILAQLLGFENLIPPFATSNKGPYILKGLNYASGAAGIRVETGSQLGGHISLDQQLLNHQYLNKCLYSVGMGNNDYINNYFKPQFYPTSRMYTLEQYTTVLIEQYSRQMMTLYDKYGARKVALVGLGLIGCTPNAISTFGTNGSACVDKLNTAAQMFNQKLVSLVDQLNANLRDAKFIYVNSFGMGSGDPAAAGFKVVNVGCCPVNNIGQCAAGKLHAKIGITAIRTYTAFDPSDAYPMDISHLVQLRL
ncbi:unnamed protein product [Prunus armeniaca]